MTNVVSPARAAMRANAPLTVVLPTPPFPATMSRRAWVQNPATSILTRRLLTAVEDEVTHGGGNAVDLRLRQCRRHRKADDALAGLLRSDRAPRHLHPVTACRLQVHWSGVVDPAADPALCQVAPESLPVG